MQQICPRLCDPVLEAGGAGGTAVQVLSADSRPDGEHARRYNKPEGWGCKKPVLVGDEPGNRDVCNLERAALIRRRTHRSFLPMHYPLLFPSGENG